MSLTILPDVSDAVVFRPHFKEHCHVTKQRQVVNHDICRVLIFEVESYGE